MTHRQRSVAAAHVGAPAMAEATKLREAAARCFRLARNIGSETDAEALRRLGRDLDRRAREIEEKPSGEAAHADD
jgi:hypothetical protein